ncbi:F-box/FBD/LRR-repeat protein At1g13570 [Linum perenne]
MQRGGEDRISSLPNNVREHILEFLPLRDAGKASILSSKWRNLWMYLPTLVFDEKFSSRNKIDVNKVMLHISTVLFLHRGPLKEVSLSLSILKRFPDQLDQILLLLEGKRIESLTIKDKEIEDYKLSRRLFSSGSLTKLKTLRLSLCRLASSPDSFGGFSMLTVLELRSVLFDCPSSTWSFRCPRLSHFTLYRCGYFEQCLNIVIEAPKLDCFHFVGTFCSLHFKNTPVLRIVTIEKSPHTWCKTKDESSLLKFWGGLAAVESLSVLSDHFYQYLAGGIQRAINPSPWEMLRHMILYDVCLSCRSNAKSVLLMMTRSPNLQQLAITMKMKDVSETSTRSFCGPSKLELSRLEIVKVERLKGTKHELAFIKWVLNSSPALDKMIIKLFTEVSDADRILILTELNGYARASARAQIIIS